MSFASVLLLMLFVLPAAAQQAMPLDARVDRLERMLENQGLMDLLGRVDQLQAEIRELRGQLEVQSHQLEKLRAQQRKMYTDLDRRTSNTRPDLTTERPPQSAGFPRPASVPPALPVTLPAVKVKPEVAPLPVGGRKKYDEALTLLKQGRYGPAAASFNDFLDRYPGSPLAANAQYWLGESYYVTRKFDQALDAFRQVVQAYPKSPKVADARLKIGFIQYERKNWKGARAQLESLTNDYPGTTVARLATTRLERMRREGR